MWIVLRNGYFTTLLDKGDLQALLDDPAKWGVTRWIADADGNWGTDDWKAGEGMLLKAEIILPVPSGKFRLPS